MYYFVNILSGHTGLQADIFNMFVPVRHLILPLPTSINRKEELSDCWTAMILPRLNTPVSAVVTIVFSRPAAKDRGGLVPSPLRA